MKKIIASTALAAVLFAGSTHAKFEGAYAGINTGYAWTKFKHSDIIDEDFKVGDKIKGALVGAQVGYGANVGDVYIGGEIRGGYSFENQKIEKNFNGTVPVGGVLTPVNVNAKIKINKKLNLGLGARIGMHFSNDILGFIRLGVDYDTYDIKGTVDASAFGVSERLLDIKGKIKTWSFVPGIGVDWKATPNLSFGILYEHAMAFTSNVSGQGESENASKLNPKSNSVRVSVSYHL